MTHRPLNMKRTIASLRLTACFATLLATFVSVVIPHSALATSGTWNGSTSAVWTNAANWSASPAPGSGETATFNGAGNGNTTIDLTGGVTNGINTFDTASAAAYTIGTGGAAGQTLTLSAPGGIRMISTVTNNQLINASLSLGTAAGAKVFTITNNSTTASLTLAGGISTAQTGNITNIFAGSGAVIISGPISNGSGSILLMKTNNPGTVILTTSNNFTGVLFNTGTGTGDCGAVRVAHSDALTGANIQMNGQNATTQTIELTNNITLTNNIGSNSRDVTRPMIRNVSGTNTYAGTYIATATGGGITFEANNGKLNMTGGLITTNAISTRILHLQGNGAGEIAYTISSLFVGSVTNLTVGTGSWTLSASNSYTGGTSIRGGTLSMAHSNALGTGGITLSGTAASNTVWNIATDGADYTNTVNGGSGTTWTIASDVKTGSVGINHTLGGFLIGSGTPALQMNVTKGPNVASGSPRITTSLLTLSGGSGGTTIVNPTTADVTFPDVTATVTSKTLQLDGTSAGNQITGVIADGGANIITLAKTNSSTWTLSGANTYTGNTTIGQGTLALTGSGSVASSTIRVLSAGTFDVSGVTYAVGGSQTLRGNGVVKGPASIQGIIIPGNPTGVLTVSNGLTFESGCTATFAFTSGTNTSLTAADALTVNGPSSIVLDFSAVVPPVGTNTLIRYGSLATGTNNLNITTSNPRYTLTLFDDTAAKAIKLIITGTPQPLVWHGDGILNYWDNTGIYSNWFNGANPDYFYDGDSVTFNNTGSNTPAIDLQNNVIAGSVTVNATQNYEIGGIGTIASPGSFTKSGAGALTLSVSNSYLGTAAINAGSVQVGNGGTSGTLDAAAITNNGALAYNRTDAVVVSAPVSGTGSLTQLGTGNLVLSGSNSYSGLTTVSVGVVQAANANALGTAASGTTVSSGGQVYITANVDFPGETFTISGTGPATDGSLRKGGAGATTIGAALTLGADSSINVDGGASLTLSNTINGLTFALTKLGGGALTLTTNSTLSGGFTLSAGTVNIGAAEALGQAPGALTIAGGSAIDNTSGAPLTLTQNPAINWNGDLTFNGTTNLNVGTGTITLVANRGLRVSGSVLTIPGNVTGGFAVTVEGAGVAALSGSNDFSGLFLDAGPQEPATVRLSNPDAAGRGNIEYNAGGNATAGRLELLGGITVTNKIRLSGRNVDATAIENLSGNNTLSGTLSIFSGGNTYLIQSDAGTLTFNGATGDGIAMTLESGTRSFTFRGAGDHVVSGIITNGAGVAGGVIKSGTGKLTLSATNSYTGTTTVNDGTLLVDGALDVGSAVTVAGGALGGTGTIGGTVTLNSGGNLSPGASIGTLTIGGSLTMNSGSTNTFEVNGSTPTNDMVVLGSTVVYGGVLNIVPGGTFTVGQNFTLFSGAGAISGFNFSNVQGNAGSGKAFSFTNGVLSVISVSSVATNPTNLTSSVTGGTTLNLSWPADHLGWLLQTQTNSRSVGLKPQTNQWFDVPGSDTITNTSITLDKTQPTIFFRLRSP